MFIEFDARLIDEKQLHSFLRASFSRSLHSIRPIITLPQTAFPEIDKKAISKYTIDNVFEGVKQKSSAYRLNKNPEQGYFPRIVKDEDGSIYDSDALNAIAEMEIDGNLPDEIDKDNDEVFYSDDSLDDNLYDLSRISTATLSDSSAQPIVAQLRAALPRSPSEDELFFASLLDHRRQKYPNIISPLAMRYGSALSKALKDYGISKTKETDNGEDLPLPQDQDVSFDDDVVVVLYLSRNICSHCLDFVKVFSFLFFFINIFKNNF